VERAVQLILAWNRPSTKVSKEDVKSQRLGAALASVAYVKANEGRVMEIKSLLSSATPPRLASVSTSEKTCSDARSTGILCLHFCMQGVFRHREVTW